MDVYFDNAATTQVCPEALAAAEHMITFCYGNPSSTHLQGRMAADELKKARRSVEALIGSERDRVFFTSGGTESDNWAISSAAHYMRHRGKHIITSAAEHDAVLNTCRRLQNSGYDVTYLHPDSSGHISCESVKNALRDDTILISLMLVNNETGAVNPIKEISDTVHSFNNGILFHTDAVQALGKIKFSAQTLGADLISISSHKIHGIKGAGALYIRPDLHLPELISGGGQEHGFRSGTEATPAIASFGAAAASAKKNQAVNLAAVSRLYNYTVSVLKENFPYIRIISSGDSPYILSISFPGYKSEVLMNFLDASGICVSNGSACKRGAKSHVLSALNLSPLLVDGAIRISFSSFNTIDETDYLVDTLLKATASIRRKL